MKLEDSGLRKQPFRTHGKPLVVVPYASQRNAIHFLDATCNNRHGLGLFHGPPLSGKTTIVRHFASSLKPDHAVAIVDGTATDAATLVQEILGQYGYRQGFNTASECFNMIRVVALQQAATGRAPILIVENVHKMNPLALEMLCELAEISFDKTSALRIILSSDRPMLPIVKAPAMRSIEERLTGKFLLKPLTRTETADYAHRKLKSGGCIEPRNVMPPAVCDRLHSASGGWPGVVDQLAMMALAKAEHIPLLVDHIPDISRKEQKPPNVVEPTAQLIVSFRHKLLEKVRLDKPRLLIGRNALCDIDLVHEWISRHHAMLIRNERSTVIVDLKSRNGTYVNGERITSHVLVNNDIISLGDHRLKFVDPTATSRTSLRGAGWDDATLAESINYFRNELTVH